MPPRFAYWTIILDGTPTSFRARERDEILPLFNQLKAKNPAALLKWFSGGKLWDSPEQAREARELEKVRQFRENRSKEVHDQRERESQALAEFRRQHGRPPDGSDQRAPRSPGPASESAPTRPAPRDERPRPERRGKDWRPGGDHKDPRDQYKLPPGQSRQRWKERHLGAKPFAQKPYGGPPKPQWPGRPGDGRRFDERAEGQGPFGQKPRGGKPFAQKP